MHSASTSPSAMMTLLRSACRKIKTMTLGVDEPGRGVAYLVAGNVVGVECSLGATPLSHLVRTLHRLADDGGLDQNGEAVLDGMSRLGVGKDRRDLAVPRIEHASRGNSVQDGPLLGREGEDRDLLTMRRDLAAERVFTTDICNVLEAGDAGARNGEGTNGDAPEGIPPCSTGVPWCLEAVAEQGR